MSSTAQTLTNLLETRSLVHVMQWLNNSATRSYKWKGSHIRMLLEFDDPYEAAREYLTVHNPYHIASVIVHSRGIPGMDTLLRRLMAERLIRKDTNHIWSAKLFTNSCHRKTQFDFNHDVVRMLIQTTDCPVYVWKGVFEHLINDHAWELARELKQKMGRAYDEAEEACRATYFGGRSISEADSLELYKLCCEEGFHMHLDIDVDEQVGGIFVYPKVAAYVLGFQAPVKKRQLVYKLLCEAQDLHTLESFVVAIHRFIHVDVLADLLGGHGYYTSSRDFNIEHVCCLLQVLAEYRPNDLFEAPQSLLPYGTLLSGLELYQIVQIIRNEGGEVTPAVIQFMFHALGLLPHPNLKEAVEHVRTNYYSQMNWRGISKQWAPARNHQFEIPAVKAVADSPELQQWLIWHGVMI